MCIACVDKPRFGGKGTKKRACIERQCRMRASSGGLPQTPQTPNQQAPQTATIIDATDEDGNETKIYVVEAAPGDELEDDLSGQAIVLQTA